MGWMDQGMGPMDEADGWRGTPYLRHASGTSEDGVVSNQPVRFNDETKGQRRLTAGFEARR